MSFFEVIGILIVFFGGIACLQVAVRWLTDQPLDGGHDSRWD